MIPKKKLIRWGLYLGYGRAGIAGLWDGKSFGVLAKERNSFTLRTESYNTFAPQIFLSDRVRNVEENSAVLRSCREIALQAISLQRLQLTDATEDLIRAMGKLLLLI